MIKQMFLEDSNKLRHPRNRLDFNVLRIHFAINRLEAFRDQTMHLAKKSPADTRIRSLDGSND
ncbi:hypothetical protein C8Q80DRAFT_1193421 [Daedaleopsis nitida]|nr:hypothetical protein C8Q80DRAFT_1193421 [Daedaleopsis nitida]